MSTGQNEGGSGNLGTHPGSLDDLRSHMLGTVTRLYIGLGTGGLALAAPEQAVLVLGPPRSGKTSALVVPNVLSAPGPLVTTSTKTDVLEATVAARRRIGRCWLFDPTGTVQAPPEVTKAHWSPVCAAGTWDEALVAAGAMVRASRSGADWEGSGHWTERAQALLAPLLHAAALQGSDMRLVLRWVLRQDATQAAATLAGRKAEIAGDVLAGIMATDRREQSGIWSTAAGVLGAYRSSAALETAEYPNFDPRRLHAGSDTVYICAPARHQAMAAPIIVAFLEQVRAGAYEASARLRRRQGAAGQLTGEGAAGQLAGERVAVQPAGERAAGQPAPVVMVLDEVANIAPLPDLPAMVSEGGGQGLLTIACLQDLSQARQRWGRAAEGFLSLFGTKVILPGIADLATLDLVSRLAGEEDVPLRSISRSPWWSGRASETETWSHHRQRRLPLDAINQLPTGRALVISGAQGPLVVRLGPWWCTVPFASACGQQPSGPREPPAPRSAQVAPPAPRSAQVAPPALGSALREGPSRPGTLSAPE